MSHRFVERKYFVALLSRVENNGIMRMSARKAWYRVASEKSVKRINQIIQRRLRKIKGNNIKILLSTQILQLHVFVVSALKGQELLMSAIFGYGAFADEVDTIGVLDRR